MQTGEEEVGDAAAGEKAEPKFRRPTMFPAAAAGGQIAGASHERPPGYPLARWYLRRCWRHRSSPCSGGGGGERQCGAFESF